MPSAHEKLPDASEGNDCHRLASIGHRWPRNSRHLEPSPIGDIGGKESGGPPSLNRRIRVESRLAKYLFHCSVSRPTSTS